MPQSNSQNIRFFFEPEVGLSADFHRKLKLILGWIFIVILGLIGLYGLVVLFKGLEGDFTDAFNVFSATLLADIFLFYLWQAGREKIHKIEPIHLKDEAQIQEIEISLFLDKAVKKELNEAWKIAYRNGYRFVRPLHIFIAFLDNKAFKKILERLNCRKDDVAVKAQKILESASQIDSDEAEADLMGPKLAPDLKDSFLKAYLFCLEQGRRQIGFLEVLWAISRQKSLVGTIFDEFGISSDEIERAVKWAELEGQIIRHEKQFFWNRLLKPKGRLNRAMTAAATPVLDIVSQDLTLMARQGRFEMVVGREKEVMEVFNLFASGQMGVALVGPGEVGKKSILKKIAQMMVEEKVPKFLKDKRLVRLDLGGLVGLGEAQQRGEEYLKRIIFEVNRAGNIILVIENIDNLVGLRSQAGGMGFAEIFASALESQAFYFLGTASTQSFASKIEGKTLDRVLSKVDIALPGRDLLWQIAIAKIFIIEKELKVVFSIDAVEQAIDLADRYFYGDTLSVRMMDILKEVAVLVKSRLGKNGFIKADDIVNLVAEKVDIPLGEVQKGEKEKLLNLEKIIHQWVVDQEEAVEAVADALRRNRLDLQRLKRPICNFLFIGPTGVGKTELAKTLARVYFGDPKRMIRLDMSEYQEKRSIRRLIGQHTEDGIQSGYLTEAVKRQPYSLLLLDEIEKAHPDILNLFLQVMDDGRLTNAAGETINFTNVILIATSNAATAFVQEEIRKGISYQAIDKQLRERVLLDYFRPEFLNRFDKVVLFKSLSMGNLVKITRLMLGGLKEKLSKRGIELEVTEEAVRELSQMGFDPLYGARSLRRVVQQRVESPISRFFLEDKISRRDKIILKKGLVFEVIKAKEF